MPCSPWLPLPIQWRRHLVNGRRSSSLEGPKHASPVKDGDNAVVDLLQDFEEDALLEDDEAEVYKVVDEEKLSAVQARWP